ncbi:hypothetical protein MTP99_011585 [Tenebrio molitor]|jgi:hypothetical protein|nr:hypothetical protein MTP99_011585 [Tenebrio molitor]
MDGSSGTLGRRGLKASAGMRRQRSLEWRQERGYSSSEEEIPTRPLDSHVFASLLAQAQQEYSSEWMRLFSAASRQNRQSVRVHPRPSNKWRH